MKRNLNPMMNRLNQLFAQNTGRGEFRLEHGDEADTIYVYDAIGGWFGVDVQDFASQLAKVKSDTLHLRINSPGGDVFDGKAMATLLREHPANVVAHVDGLAASAATMLVNAADERVISAGSFFMIHNAWTACVGNRHDMLDIAEVLEQIDGSLVDDYVAVSNADEDQIRAWMDAETWLSADEALEHGFIDALAGKDTESAENRIQFDLSAYENAPQRPADPWKEHKARLSARLRMAEGMAA